MRVAYLASVVSFLVLAGCASPDPSTTTYQQATRKRIKNITTRAGDQVTMQWNSEATLTYAIIYTMDLNQQRKWRLLPGFDSIRGTGEPLIVTFTAPVKLGATSSELERIYYRLQSRPSSSWQNSP